MFIQCIVTLNIIRSKTKCYKRFINIVKVYPLYHDLKTLVKVKGLYSADLKTLINVAGLYTYHCQVDLDTLG